MTAAVTILRVPRDRPWTHSFTWKSGSPLAAVDLTGFTARMALRDTVQARDPVATLTTENGGITLGGVDGTVTLSIPDPTVIADGAFERQLRFDLELLNGPTPVDLIEGHLLISAKGTRA